MIETKATIDSPIFRMLAVLAFLVIIVAGLKATAVILVPFMIAVVLSVLASRPLLWMESHGMNHSLAAMVTIVFMTLIIFAFITFIRISMGDINSMLPHYQALFKENFSALHAQGLAYGIDITQFSLSDSDAVQGAMATMLKGVGSVASKTLIVLFILFFILFEVASFPKKLEKIWDHEGATVQNIKKVVYNINHYIAIKTTTSLLTGLIVALFASIMGLDFAIFLGIIAFLLNFIPTIGSIIAAIPALILAWVTLGMESLIYTTIGYAVINLSISNIIEPKLMGRGLGLSALVVFLSLIFWGWVFGIVGMLFSAILTMMLKVSLEHSAQTRWIASLMEDPQKI